MKAIGDRLDLSLEVAVAVAANGSKTRMPFGDLVNGPTIVSVYMRNNTGSCDKQMESLAEAAPRIRKLGYSLVGVSKDTAGSHLKYAAKHGIDFPLASDPEHAFARATDSLIEKKMYGRVFWGPSRSAYVLDAEGALVALCEKVDPARHGEQMIELLQTL